MIIDRLPEAIVFASEGVENAETLLREKTRQIGIGAEETAEIPAGGTLILDFGREIAGGARILSYFLPAPVPVRLRFGESVSETCAELGEKNATNDHALRDFTVALPQLSDGVYGQTGFRFLRIDAAAPLSLKSVLAHDHRTDLVSLGSFRCDDEEVCRIYETARETLFCCVQNGYLWDGVKRDRLVWIGDLHPEMMGLLATAGGAECIVNCLRLAVEQTPLPAWMNGIPAYSLWWIVDLGEYFEYSGDLALLKEMEGYLSALLLQIDGCVGADGTTHFPYDFLDWPTHGQEDELAGQAALALIAARRARALLARLGADDRAARSLEEKLLRRREGVKRSKQALAMRALAGYEDKRDAAAALVKSGSRGFSAFMSYYILRAIAEGGRGEEAVSLMKEYYGGMLSRGARTFWEDFSVDWLEGSGRIDCLPLKGERDIHGDYGAFCYEGFRHSLCHGWSCGPVPFLAQVVLGVRVREEGCKKLEVRPDLCGLSYAEGSVPTPYGPVEVRAEREKDGGTRVTVSAPPEVEIIK